MFALITTLRVVKVEGEAKANIRVLIAPVGIITTAAMATIRLNNKATIRHNLAFETRRAVRFANAHISNHSRVGYHRRGSAAWNR